MALLKKTEESRVGKKKSNKNRRPSVSARDTKYEEQNVEVRNASVTVNNVPYWINFNESLLCSAAMLLLLVPIYIFS